MFYKIINNNNKTYRKYGYQISTPVKPHTAQVYDRYENNVRYNTSRLLLPIIIFIKSLTSRIYYYLHTNT